MATLDLPVATHANPYASSNLDHHGLVAGRVDEWGLVGKIDALIPQDLGQRHVSAGLAVKAMILIGLGFVHRALCLTPHFFQGKPVERLPGSGITAGQLNDDVLGRALDAICAFGAELFHYLPASAVVKPLGVTCAGGRLDATGFHVDGEYNSGNDAVAEGAIPIRPGYSRGHRPDVGRAVLQLTTENQAGIPLWRVPLGGNVNGQAGFRDTVATYVGQLQTDVGLQCLVAGSALYNEKSLQALGGA